MRIAEIINEGTVKPKHFRDHPQATRAAIAMAKPELCANGWEITISRYMVTMWGEAALDEMCDHSWDWCVRAIAALRVEMVMPPKDFPKPPEKTKTGFIATKPKTLLHGTSRAAATSIAERGLIPQVGRFTRATYGHKEHPALIFASSTTKFQRVVSAMFASTADIETDSEFFEKTALVFLQNDGRWYQQKSGYESPATVEGGDFYRFEPIAAKKILVGDKLRAYFENRIGHMPSFFVDFIEPN